MTAASQPRVLRPLLPQGLPDRWDSTAGEHAAPVNPPRRTRTGGPRSRAGCSTCRKRRVKCDEGLPTCARCAKAKLCCDGYSRPPPAPAKPKASRAPGPPPTIAPKPADPAEASAALMRSMTGLPVIDGPDVAYFDVFRHQVVRELADGYYAQLWSIAVSEGLRHGCVRDSVLAIGALARAISFAKEDQQLAVSAPRCPTVSAPWSHKNPANEHHRASLIHHLRAVSAFRKLIGNTKVVAEPRKVFIMTLLLIVYEMLQGHVAASDNILNCGMAVFRGSNSLFLGTHAPGDGLEDIEHVLPRLSMMGIFTHQHNSGWSYVHQLRAEPEFKFPKPGVDPVSKLFAFWGRFFTLSVTYLGQIGRDGDLRSFSSTVRQANFLTGLRQWKPILQHYLNESEPNTTDRRALCLTLLHWDVIWISMKGSVDPTALTFDTLTDHFRNLLYRCDNYMKMGVEAEAPRIMTFGEGVLMPLLCIVKCCRDHDLRMAAAAIAYEIPWRESTWDARVVLLGLLGAVAMEENERDSTGFIPSHARWYWKGNQVCSGTNEMIATYERHEPDDEGNPCSKSLTIDLDEWPDICAMVGCEKDHTATLTMGRSELNE